MSERLYTIELTRHEAALVLRALDNARGDWPIADNDTAVNLADYIEAETNVRLGDE